MIFIQEGSLAMMKIYEIVLSLVQNHQENSEKVSKYYSIFLQHYMVQEHYR